MFSLKFIWCILLVGIILSLGYLVFVNVQARQYTPQKISEKFLILTQNPTHKITKEEKKILKEITQSSLLDTIQYEKLIKSLRTIEGERQSLRVEVNQIEDSDYFIGNIVYNESGENETKVRLYIEKYGKWYTGYRYQIYHIEIKSKASLTKDLKESVQTNLDKVKDGAKERFEKVKENFLDKI